MKRSLPTPRNNLPDGTRVRLPDMEYEPESRCYFGMPEHGQSGVVIGRHGCLVCGSGLALHIKLDNGKVIAVDSTTPIKAAQ